MTNHQVLGGTSIEYRNTLMWSVELELGARCVYAERQQSELWTQFANLSSVTHSFHKTPMTRHPFTATPIAVDIATSAIVLSPLRNCWVDHPVGGKLSLVSYGRRREEFLKGMA